MPPWCGGSRGRIVDLSHPLTEATPVYPGDPEPRIFTATTVGEDGYNLSHVHLGTQTGTHVDAPFHFRDDGATIDRVPLALTAGPGVVAPVAGKTAGERITLDDLEPHRGRLAPGCIVLFCTGWYRHAGTPAFFEHPYLEAAVGEALLEAGVRTLAIDTLNADFTGGDDFPIHDMFAAAGGLIAENLAGTEALTPGVEPLLLLLPLNLVGCDGAPVRAVAFEPVR
ncbi:MAG: cyclase family protein [Thermoleophilia bacterium]|nr:cyclase family protein [Thermoleophilia bacterium]